MNHSEIAHKWAQQEKPCNQNSNLWYDGPSIYSYGQHFEIARFVNPDTVLFNSDSYSNSTAKHQTHVSRAITHKTVFYVPNFFELKGDKHKTHWRDKAHKANIAHYCNEVKEKVNLASRARIYTEYHIRDATMIRETMQRYVQTFKVPKACLSKQYQEIMQYNFEQFTTLIADQKEKVKIADLKAEKLAQTKLKKWLKGDTTYIYGLKKVHLRLVGDVVETSQGSKVPAREAKILLRYVRQSKTKEVNLNGHSRIGSFYINECKNGNLTIGCHKIRNKEIESFAKTQNW